MHAELARRVRGGRHHAAFIGPAAHHYRLAFQRRVGQLFHRDEERVHIDVKESAHHTRVAIEKGRGRTLRLQLILLTLWATVFGPTCWNDRLVIGTLLNPSTSEHCNNGTILSGPGCRIHRSCSWHHGFSSEKRCPFKVIQRDSGSVLRS